MPSPILYLLFLFSATSGIQGKKQYTPTLALCQYLFLAHRAQSLSFGGAIVGNCTRSTVNNMTNAPIIFHCEEALELHSGLVPARKRKPWDLGDPRVWR